MDPTMLRRHAHNHALAFCDHAPWQQTRQTQGLSIRPASAPKSPMHLREQNLSRPIKHRLMAHALANPSFAPMTARWHQIRAGGPRDP